MKRIIDKWISMPNSVKSAIAFAFSSFFIRGISFITTPIFTRIMEGNQYGQLATYNSWLSIIEVFAVLGLTSAGVFNSGLNEYRDRRDSYIFSIQALCNVTTIITFGVIFGVKCFLNSDFLKLDINLIILMFIHFMLWPSQIFWITRQRYEYKYKLATFISIGSILLGQILAIIAVMASPVDRQGVSKLWANEIGVIVFCIPIFFLIVSRGKNTDFLSIWKKTLIFALPLIPHYLAQHVMAGADRIMIGDIISSADAGIYNVVANISMIAVIFWNAVNASLIPYTYEKLNIAKYDSLKVVVKLLLLAYGCICFVVVLVAPEILKILAPQEYFGGIYAIPPIVAVAFINALYNLYANIEFYYKKSSTIAFATIIASLINICLNSLLIPRFSYIGAAYTTLISNIVLLIMHYLGYRNSSKTHIYDDGFIAYITIFITVVSILSTMLYANDFIRYIFIGAVMIVMIFLKERIKSTITKIKKEIRG